MMTEEARAEIAQGLRDLERRTRKPGYSAREVADLAGITYRQLDYWCRNDIIRPGLVDAHGSGSRRRYSEEDLVVLRFMRQMLDCGINLDRIRMAVESIKQFGLRTGQIVVLTGHRCILVDTVADPQMVELMRTEPCQTFPIVFPDE